MSIVVQISPQFQASRIIVRKLTTYPISGEQSPCNTVHRPIISHTIGWAYFRVFPHSANCMHGAAQTPSPTEGVPKLWRNESRAFILSIPHFDTTNHRNVPEDNYSTFPVADQSIR